MKNTTYIYFFASLFGVICGQMANAEPMPSSNVEQLAAMLNSSFETPDSDVENIILDRRVRFSSEKLEGVWFYYQLNTGKNGKLYRQRFFNLIETREGVRQKTYTPLNSARWEDAWTKPGLLDSVSAEDFESSFDQSCDLIWTQLSGSKWSGYVDPKLCKYFSKRRNVSIYIESESIVDTKTLKQSERGFDADGQQLWGTEPGDYILLNRIPVIKQ